MEKQAKELNAPVYQKEKVVDKDAFKITVFAVLSTRTKDETTIKVCKRLFEKVKNFEDLLKIDEKELESLLYGIGFYRNKAKILKKLAKEIIEKYNSIVPNKLEELVKLPGIGLKVAKVILNEAFNLPYVAVDTHVLRISNRLGIINTKDFKEANEILENILPENLKIKYNKTLVAFGQTVCKPKNPKCEICKVKDFCKYYKNKKISKE